MRALWTLIVLLLVMWVAAPVLTRLAHALFIPVVVCLALYLAIRLVEAYRDRWW
jgi:predicted membrane chloride channel (bestrophin family)